MSTKAKQPSQPPLAPQQAGTYRAKVPVKISIGHGETVIDEYEDVIDIDFTDVTPEGKKPDNIALSSSSFLI